MTVAEARKMFKERMRAFVDDGGQIVTGTFGKPYAKGGRVYCNGPACAITAAAVGEFWGDGYRALLEGCELTRLLGLTEAQAEQFIDGFDNGDISTRSKWYLLGKELREEFINDPQ